MANKTYIKIKILEYQLKPKNTEFFSYQNFEKKINIRKVNSLKKIPWFNIELNIILESANNTKEEMDKIIEIQL